jgi:hypothetical protein
MSRLWSIAAYFNPCRYRSRIESYRIFRERLQTPLLTVELSFEEPFELGPGSAEILVQKRGGDVMWQKERLLNIALEHLPGECDAVAWLDSDILFTDDGWPARAQRALEQCPLIQPFSTCRDQLARESGGLTEPAPSYAACRRVGVFPERVFTYDREGRPRKRNFAPGFAWAARRELIERVRFYDGSILGGGDMALVNAGMGRIDDEIRFRMPSQDHARHYRSWAEPFRQALGGEIGHIPGEVIHLWHGDLRDRQYRARHEDFARFAFDPGRDIALDADGCWRWASEKPALHAFVRDHFTLRNEDGNGDDRNPGPAGVDRTR